MFPQDLLSPLGIGAESKERQQHVVCYRAVVETRVLDLKERRGNEDLKLTQLLCWPT